MISRIKEQQSHMCLDLILVCPCEECCKNVNSKQVVGERINFQISLSLQKLQGIKDMF